MADDGFATPEEAAPGDIPSRFVTVVGTLIVEDMATVWMLTNDRPPYEEYTVSCYRESGRWFGGSGICGLSSVDGMGFPPEAVIANADRFFSKAS